jgi:hypothetical protein
MSAPIHVNTCNRFYNRSTRVDIPQLVHNVPADVQMAREWNIKVVKIRRSRTEAGFEKEKMMLMKRA